MQCQPEVLLYHRKKPKISVILIDWGVRESFHSLHYLNRQTAPRDDYELIWLEFYRRKPEGLRRRLGAGGPPVLDKWVVAGYPDECVYHKHRLYNVGILLSDGEVCVICDSDAIFRPTFIERLVAAFEETPRAVVHLDEVRNNNPALYPFNYPSIATVLGPGCYNWDGRTTWGLGGGDDMIHQANYGACMAARRRDLLAIGGADEHLDYLGYICGPYDMTFRLVNYGRPERWLRDEYLYHVWHPNQTGINTDYHGPDDDRSVSARALDARHRFRVRPCVMNPWVAEVRRGRSLTVEKLLRRLKARPEPHWVPGGPAAQPGEVYWVGKDYHGFNLFKYRGRWFALPEREGVFHPEKAARGRYRELIRAASHAVLQQRVLAANSRRAQVADPLPGPVRAALRKIWFQPFGHLPARVAKRTRLWLSCLRPEPPPWGRPGRAGLRGCLAGEA